MGALAPKMDPEAGVAPKAVEAPPPPKALAGAVAIPKAGELPAGALTDVLPKLNIVAEVHQRSR